MRPRSTEGKLENGTFSFSAGVGVGRGGSASTTFTGKVEGDSLVGTVTMGAGRRPMEGTFVGTRTSGAATARAGESTLRRGKKTKDGSADKNPRSTTTSSR